MFRSSLLVMVTLFSVMASAGEPPKQPSLDAADEETETQDSWPSGSHAPTAVRANRGTVLPSASGVHIF